MSWVFWNTELASKKLTCVLLLLKFARCSELFRARMQNTYLNINRENNAILILGLNGGFLSPAVSHSACDKKREVKFSQQVKLFPHP